MYSPASKKLWNVHANMREKHCCWWRSSTSEDSHTYIKTYRYKDNSCSACPNCSFSAMSANDTSGELTDLQKTCLDRLLEEATTSPEKRPRKKIRLPMPPTMPKESKHESKDLLPTTISDKLWDDEWGLSGVQGQQTAQTASSSSTGQPDTFTNGEQTARAASSSSTGQPDTFTKGDKHPKGNTPKGTITTPKGTKSVRWIPDPTNPREVELRRQKDMKNKREVSRNRSLESIPGHRTMRHSRRKKGKWDISGVPATLATICR